MRNDRTSVHNQFIENYLCEMSGYRNENTNILLLIFMIAVSTAWAFYQVTISMLNYNHYIVCLCNCLIVFSKFNFLKKKN